MHDRETEPNSAARPLDLTPLLAGWEFRPGEIAVRYVAGLDGREKLQLRIDLGVMQLELDGRPDGKRIRGCESWLDWHRGQQAEHDAEHQDRAPYRLASEDCAELMREGVQYYHRYLGFWHSERYELCARDTQRNLSLFAFVRAHAEHQRDKLQFDQWRPYVTMMHARAVATPLVELRQWDAALGAVSAAITHIDEFLAEYDQQEQASSVGELVFLRRWKQEILSLAGLAEGGPTADDPLAEVERRLAAAVEQERYEEAARLRDELRRLKEPPPPGGNQP